jgi:hypothetical protein
MMLVHGLHPDTAFAMLGWWSRNRNVKVRDLADRTVQAAGTGELTSSELRTEVDRALDDATA